MFFQDSKIKMSGTFYLNMKSINKVNEYTENVQPTRIRLSVGLSLEIRSENDFEIFQFGADL